jgi:hypothetical protein
LPADHVRREVVAHRTASFPGLLSATSIPIRRGAADVILPIPNFQIQALGRGSTDIGQYVR